MSWSSSSAEIATLGIDLGKNSFHLVGQDERGAIVLRIKLSRAWLSQRLANIPPCPIGMEAYAGAHHIGRQLQALGHDVHLIPAQYIKPFHKGHKNDYPDAEAAQRPTMSFVTIKTPDQMDMLTLHRVRSRLVGRRERAHALVQRAVARGELEDSVDRETIADLVAAPLYWRLVVVGGRSDREHIRRLARKSAAAARVA